MNLSYTPRFEAFVFLNKMQILKVLNIATLCITTFATAFAEEPLNLPDLIISESSEKTASQQTSLSTNFNRDSLSTLNKPDLNSALRGLSSVGISQGTPGMTSNLILRGASGGLGLVNFDGVPLFGSFTGFFPLSHYPLDLLDNVSVFRGFNDEHNSSRTLGGSINLSSRNVSDGKAFLHTEGGSYGTLRNNLGAGTHNQLGDWSFAGGRSDIFQGISQAGPQNGGGEPKSSQMTNGMLNWRKDISNLSLDSSVYFVETRDGYDGPGILPNRTIGWKSDPNGILNQQTWVAQSRVQYQVLDNWESALKMGYTQDKQTGRIGTIMSIKQPYCCSMDLTSQLWLGNWENTHQFAITDQKQDALKFIWGVDTQHQQGDSIDNYAKAHTLTSHLISPLTRIELIWKDWLAGTEVRYDHYDYYDYYDYYGDHTVFNTNIGWHFNPAILVWVKGGTGYRAPAVNERLHPSFGNLSVVPESNTGGELGLRWQFNKLTELNLSGYIQHYQNLIVLQQQTNGLIRSLNVAQAHLWGTELQARHQWTTQWASGLSYSYMEATDPQTNLAIPSRPNNQGQFWTQYQLLDPVTIKVDLTYRDGYWSDISNKLRIQAAPRLNANINYQINPKLAVYARGENLNNERTPDLLGFNYLGIGIYGGINVNY